MVRAAPHASHEVMREFVHMQGHHRAELQNELVQRIEAQGLLRPMPGPAIRDEVQAMLDFYVDVLETGDLDGLQRYAGLLADRLSPRGSDSPDVLGVLLVMRDVLARAILDRYQSDRALLYRVLDAFEQTANRIASMAALGFVRERERVILAQQKAIRELSTPVLLLREKLLILPIIGVVDPVRARQITDQVLIGVQTHRARVVVMDMTGMASVDETVAGHLVRTVDAARLLGASVILTGLSAAIAQTLVSLGTDLSKMHTVGDLQGGIEEAERMLRLGSYGLSVPTPAVVS